MKKLILNNTFWLLSNNLSQIIIGFIILFLLTNNLSKSFFGEIMYSLSIISILKVVVDLGIEKLIIRKQLEDIQNFSFSNSIILLRIYISGILFVGSIIYLFASSVFLNKLSILPILLTIIFSPLETIISYFKSIDKNIYIFIPNIISQLILLITIYVIITFKLPKEVIGLPYLIQMAIYSILVLFFSKKLKFKWNFEKNNFKVGFKEILPFSIISFAAILNERLDHLLIGSFVGFKELAVFSVATKVTDVFKILPAVIASVSFPSLYKSKNNRFIYTQKSLLFLFISGAIISLIIIKIVKLSSEYLINIFFNEEYYGMIDILNILIYSIIPYYIFFIVSQLFYIEKKENYLVLTSITTIIITVIINYILINSNGIIGATYAKIINSFIPYLFMLLLLFKLKKVK